MAFKKPYIVLKIRHIPVVLKRLTGGYVSGYWTITKFDVVYKGDQSINGTSIRHEISDTIYKPSMFMNERELIEAVLTGIL